MTTGSIAHIPLALGSGLAALAGMGIRWCVDRFVQTPMATSGIVLVAGLTLMGGANALFMQDTRHPAPLFVSGDAVPQAGGQSATPPPVEPVVVQPIERPEGLTTQSAPAAQPAPQAENTPAPAQQSQESRPVGNADIAELQQKLQALGLFDGTVDGFYGPKTADAIRAFESRFGMPRTGAASREVLDAVRQAPLDGAQNAVAAQAPTPPQSPQQQAQAQAQPQPQSEQSAAPLFDPSEQTGMVGMAEMGDIGALIADSEPALQQEANAQTSQPMPERVETASAPSITDTVMSLNPLGQDQGGQAAVPPSRDRELVSTVQRGLNRLGFLQGSVSGVADATTARAIRQFQIFHNYRPTGEVTLDLVDMLEAAGAYM